MFVFMYMFLFSVAVSLEVIIKCSKDKQLTLL